MTKIRSFCQLICILVFYTNALSTEMPLFISLGSACGPATHLRNLNLRLEAYPFDWLVSRFHSLYKALEDNFEYFLTDLVVRNDNVAVIDHYGFEFTHDWPNSAEPNADGLTNDSTHHGTLAPHWRDALPAVREKYQRRINRFNEACASSKKIIFLRVEETTQEQAILLRQLIRNKYPSLQFVLIVISPSADFVEPWNIDGIYNFHGSQWDNSINYETIFKHLSIPTHSS